MVQVIGCTRKKLYTHTPPHTRTHSNWELLYTSLQWGGIVESGETATLAATSLSVRLWAVAWHLCVVTPPRAICFCVMLDGQATMFRPFLLLGAFIGRCQHRLPIKSVYDDITVYLSKILRYCSLATCWSVASIKAHHTQFLLLLPCWTWLIIPRVLCILSSQLQLVILCYWTHDEGKFPWQELSYLLYVFCNSWKIGIFQKSAVVPIFRKWENNLLKKPVSQLAWVGS